MSDFESGPPRVERAKTGGTVSYKGKLLYSKYEPGKTILKRVERLSVSPGTLLLVFSPCMAIGLDELSRKLPSDCFALGCEWDEALFEFSKKYFTKGESRALASPADLARLPSVLMSRSPRLLDGTPLPAAGTFRKILRVDFSGGVSLNARLYDSLFDAAQDALARFWKNRLTLVKFGRRYSRDFFTNLARLPESAPLAERSVKKPILVCGAGESLEKTAREIQGRAKNFYVLSVDAALPSLRALGVEADAVVSDEAQAAIARSFIGAPKNVRAFLAMTSRPGAARAEFKRTTYFYARYCDANFLDDIAALKILPEPFLPMGSVGLTAARLALALRAGDDVPIFVTGLDFSYSAGRTHALSSDAHTLRLSSSWRAESAENYGAAFGGLSKKERGVDGGSVFTSEALLSYARLFRALFSRQKNMFDARESGLDIGLERKPCGAGAAAEGETADEGALEKRERRADETREKVLGFLRGEKSALEELLKILSDGAAMEEGERKARLARLLERREYLYLHFPDGNALSLEPNFLSRVRAEAAFFMKDICRAIGSLDGGRA